MKQKIAFVAGHSGGHIIPCITQAKKEFSSNDTEIIFFCTNNDLDKKILNKQDFIKYKIFLPNINLKNKLKFIFNFKITLIKSLFLLIKFRPQKIVSMGGLISIPACLAAKILIIPIELWELNVEPGKAVRFISKFTNSINLCFDETQKYFPTKKCNIVEYPVRFNHNDKSVDKIQILKNLNFNEFKKTIFIIGGSQGSIFINNLILNFIAQRTNLNNQIQIIHQTGIDSFDWQNFYKSFNIPAITFDFYNKIEQYYAISDLIICRSGAGTLSEIVFFEKPCITIPLETSSTKHQSLNAYALANKYPNLIYVVEQKKIENNKKLFTEYICNKIIN